MKTFMLSALIIASFIPAPVFADNAPAHALQPSTSGTIIVNIVDLNKPVGMLGVSLYNSRKGFPAKHDQAYINQVKKITGSSEKVIFENVPYGSYAISVAHDENSNGKLDSSFIGIPKEGVGLSNNPKIGMGGPKYDPCTFTLDTGLIDLTITMKYL